MSLIRPIRTPFRLDAAQLDAHRLTRIRQGGDQLLDAQLALQKKQHSVLSSLMPKTRVFSLWDHYPAGEVSDLSTACQYYYHSHRTTPQEHGHFHLFGLLNADGSTRAPNSRWAENEAPSHLIAISMSPQGMPVKVFCPNQWVTNGYWLTADQILVHLENFIVNAQPRWAVVGRWLAGFVQLFWPQIESALRARDERVKGLRRGRQWRTFWADESIEVINYIPIDLHQQVGKLEGMKPAKQAIAGQLRSAQY